MLKILAVPMILLLTATPALAVSCYGAGADTGVVFGFGFQIGDVTEDDEAQFDLMRLRRTGVDATSVEYWNGCIRAWVRNNSGSGVHMEFYYPGSLRRADE